MPDEPPPPPKRLTPPKPKKTRPGSSESSGGESADSESSSSDESESESERANQLSYLQKQVGVVGEGLHLLFFLVVVYIHILCCDKIVHWVNIVPPDVII